MATMLERRLRRSFGVLTPDHSANRVAVCSLSLMVQFHMHSLGSCYSSGLWA